MINPFKEVNWHPGAKEKRAFARSLIIGFPVIAVLMLLVGHFVRHEWPLRQALTIGGTGLALGLLCLVLPVLARPFYLVWYGIACCMGIVVGNIALSLIYVVVVAFIGLLLKLCGHRALRLRPDPHATTYWKDAPPTPAVNKYFQQY